MKRSLFIAIVVLLMAALFVSCNAEKSLEDQLVEVTIAGETRALSAVGNFDATTATVAELEWYYTAVKTSGYYRTGEHTTLTPVKSGVGLANATLGDANGKMSVGGWDFCFYGYIAGTIPAADPKANAVYYQEGLHKTISGNIALEVSLTRGNGGQVDPVAVVENGELFWTDALGGLTGDMILKISKDSVALIQYQTTVSGGKATFTNIANINLVAGANNELLFEVFNRYTDDGVTIEEKLGSSLLTIAATAGMRYTITSDTVGISPVSEEPVVITIGDIEVPVVTTNAVVASTTVGESKVESANTPAGGTNEKTTVEFPIDLTGKQVRVETSSAEVASAKAFTVSADSAVVGSISLSISDGTTTFENGKAIVSTFIGKGLSGVEVHYNGAASEDIAQADVDYDPESGYVTFATPHFSEFYVTAKGEAKIGSKVYNTLVEAIKAAENGATVTLLKNASGAGVFVEANANRVFTVDLGGFTYTCTGPAVGSANTQTQAWHLEKNNSITIKNGTVTSTATAGVYMLVQNYCNLTLEDVTLDGTNIPGSGQYVLSGNNGDILVTGDTDIIAKSGDYAFDVCYTNYYPDGVRYLFDENYTGTVTGTIQFDVWGTKPATPKCSLTIKAGTFNGAFEIESALQSEAYNDILILGGTFNGIQPVAMVNGAVYGSLMAAIDSVADNATATIKLLRDVTDGTGLATDSTDADAHKKNLTIDFNGKTYTMKDPAVGSTYTQTQAMHWAAGSTIVLKNGTFAVQADAVNVKMGMQNYAALTIEDMVIDTRAVAARFYGDYTGTSDEAYSFKQIPVFNNNSVTATLYIKDSSIISNPQAHFALYTMGALTIENCEFINNNVVCYDGSGASITNVDDCNIVIKDYFAD